MKSKSKEFKCGLVKRSLKPGLLFNHTLAKRGYWEEKVNQLQADPDSMLEMAEDDKSSLTQLQAKAKKLGVVLLFARDGDTVYARAYLPSEEQARLVLPLREPRTVNELKSKGLEINLEAELQTLAGRGQVLFAKDRWKLTDKGLADLLPGEKRKIA